MASTPPGRSPSPPSLTSNSGSPSPRRTNTLVITQLPATFFEPVVLEALQHHFATYGPIYAWAPLKSFYRIILVYRSEDDAEHAKESCDHLIVGSIDDRWAPLHTCYIPTRTDCVCSPAVTLRVFRADPTTILTPSGSGEGNMYLRPPEQEKNFLISPPGSPPVGWEPIREEPPNPTPLADDLMTALKRLQIQEESRHRGPGPAVLLEPEDGVGISVYVEDCGDGEGARWTPAPTALPPMPIRA
ncbi:Calcipressin-domain-containing protein [Fomitopsis serialis]|uniref:Calcipressin-domain-containing protein n=1 Tax=Fomitopsis serialis TaxID=139415 RepID=UPI0020086CFC|nr:Calcipressin-domain-containing protein [Neoantrodia serialis]KAH9930832.1 Calcipressin-domain-containing protein [Neoantrodia serialis]